MIQRNLHWRRDREFNFGDRLAPWLFTQLTGETARWVSPRSAEPYLTLVGSFLELVTAKAHVWGTGIIRAEHQPCPQAHYHAVRGPLTRQQILRAGGECPEIYGDPVSLLPLFYPLQRQPKYLGLIPQWRERAEDCFLSIHDKNVLLLDITAKTEQFLAELATCEVVLSSSLHGIVAAHAYGIPALWLQPTTKPLGDGTKFRDYLASVDLYQVRGAQFAHKRDLLQLARHAQAPNLKLQSFLQAFPTQELGLSSFPVKTSENA